MKKRLKINGFIIALAIVFLILFPAVFLRSTKEASWDKLAEISGIAFILLGQIFRASSRGYKSENSGSGHSLIQSGPYALVRNPMYLGILFIGLGIVLVLFNWWMLVVFLCIFIWRYILLIFKEEKKLLAMFPQAYRDYQQKVPRLLPSITRVLKKDIAEYLPLKAPWLKKEIGSILTVLLIVLFMEGWKDVKNEGIKVYLKEVMLFLTIIILFIFFIIYLIRRTNNQQKDASNKSKNTL
jgi:protein-S-isoprenylcysteine O-methyltransferase Ste14